MSNSNYTRRLQATYKFASRDKSLLLPDPHLDKLLLSPHPEREYEFLQWALRLNANASDSQVDENVVLKESSAPQAPKVRSI